jgi:hypothetical protein
MTFLELCRKVALESGTIAGIPSFTTLAGATGRLAKLAGWVSDAYRDIQNERPDWLWLRKEFTKALIADQATYTPASFSLEVARWLGDTKSRRTLSLYDSTIGVADEGALCQIPYDSWRDRYYRGEHDANRPTVWTIKPEDKSLCFGPTPDAAYVIRGEYIARPQILALDADEPDMPEHFHGVIVGEALRLMARSDEAFQSLAPLAAQYDRLRHPLVIEQTPDFNEMWSGPLGV